jgi:hypothetical protein
MKVSETALRMLRAVDRGGDAMKVLNANGIIYRGLYNQGLVEDVEVPVLGVPVGAPGSLTNEQRVTAKGHTALSASSQS